MPVKATKDIVTITDQIISLRVPSFSVAAAASTRTIDPVFPFDRWYMLEVDHIVQNVYGELNMDVPLSLVQWGLCVGTDRIGGIADPAPINHPNEYAFIWQVEGTYVALEETTRLLNFKELLGHPLQIPALNIGITQYTINLRTPHTVLNYLPVVWQTYAVITDFNLYGRYVEITEDAFNRLRGYYHQLPVTIT